MNSTAKVFAIADVKFDSIAQLVKEALSRTNIEGGKVTHVEVKRNLPFEQSVHLRVFISGTRKFAFVDHDASGKFKKVTFT